MPRESLAAKVARTKAIVAGLRKAYPDAHCELNYTNPLELLVATILSAQATDKQVNLVTPDLFKKYRSAGDFAQAELLELEKSIQRLGFFRNKAKSIQSCCRDIRDKHGGSVPQYVIDAPGGGGKVPINPGYVLSHNADRVVIRNFEGKVFEYPEPGDNSLIKAPEHSEAELV